MCPAVYQFAAKPGLWRVYPIYNDNDYTCAFIACHESADANKLVQRCGFHDIINSS
jgi:hypothetical protein